MRKGCSPHGAELGDLVVYRGKDAQLGERLDLRALTCSRPRRDRERPAILDRGKPERAGAAEKREFVEIAVAGGRLSLS